MSIEIYFEDIPPIPFQEDILMDHIIRLVKNEDRRCGNISVIFCSDDYLLNMNREYLKHDYYTDIITFDYVEGEMISGDLFISYERVKENANALGSLLNEEIYRIIFHGILHLVGYKDKTKKEKEIMTQKENFYLSEVDFSSIVL